MIDIKRYLFVLSLVLIICYAYKEYFIRETFVVAHNTHSVPRTESSAQKTFQESRQQFGRLVQLVNSTNYKVTYNMENILGAFEAVLNKQDISKYHILSIGDTKPFTLYDVIIQDVQSLATIRFKRVDFMVDSLNPFVIKNVIIHVDPDYTTTQNLMATQELQPDTQFRIKNPLNLFAPYDTTDNENIRTGHDLDELQKIIKEKQEVLKKF